MKIEPFVVAEKYFQLATRSHTRIDTAGWYDRRGWNPSGSRRNSRPDKSILDLQRDENYLTANDDDRWRISRH